MTCRDVLVGKLAQPSNQVELITLALIYKFMDDLDEESVKLGGKRSFCTGELAKFRWRNLLPQTVFADERVTLFSEGIEALGNAFEYLLQCTGAQGENGQFRTPRHIIDFIVACLDPHPGDKILDPACGTGGFLVSAYRHILAHSTSPGSTLPGDKLTHAQRQKVYANLAAYDVDDQMVKLSKVILFLKITADGFDIGDQRRGIEANDLPEADRIVKAWLKRKLDSSFEPSLAWKLVEKATLLEHRACSLQPETFFGEKAVASSVEMVALADGPRSVAAARRQKPTQLSGEATFLGFRPRT